MPLLSLLAKDHKAPDPTTGDPKTRPVCGASRSPNGELSELLSDVLEAASHADRRSQESFSTEDFLSKVDSKLEEIGLEGLVEGELFVGSLYVQGLFPALDIPTVTRICAKRWRSSGLRILGANYSWAQSN